MDSIQQTKTNSPVPLIQISDGQFYLAEEGKKLLSSIKNPLGIITIVGKYRTGKSLFLNKVFLNSSNAFKVSPTVNSCTKGLWVYSQTLKVTTHDGKEAQVLIMDTEGFGAMQETNNYNNKIILFAMLLSSYFIYNSVGSIDQNSLNNLTVIVNMAKEIQMKNNGNDQIDHYFPSFLWLVRDFTLNLVDKQGIPITSKQYLQNALQIQKGTSDNIQAKNKIRRMLKHFFKDRDCFTLRRPVQTESQLQKLNQLQDADLRPEFVEQINKLRSKILNKVKPKKLKNQIINGEMLIQLISFYLQSVNKGSMPNFELSWKFLTNCQSNRLKRKILEKYEAKLSEIFSEMQTQESIREIEKNILTAGIQDFRTNKLGSEKQCQQNMQSLQAELQEKVKQFKKKNNDKSRAFLQGNFFELVGCRLQDNCNLKQLKLMFKDLQTEFRKLNAKNPLLQQYIRQEFANWKLQQTMQRLATQQEKAWRDNQKDQAIKQKLEQQLNAERIKVSELTTKLSECQRKMMIDEAKHSEQFKIKSMEIQFLKKNLSKLEEEQKHLQKNLSYNQGQMQQKNQSLQEMHKKCQQLQTAKRLVSEEKAYLEKQLQILRNSLNSKSNQLGQLKQQFQEVSLQLEKTLERQKVIQSRITVQTQNSTSNYGKLLQKYELVLQQLKSCAVENAKIKEEKNKIEQICYKEKQIYENMFETFKENLNKSAIDRKQLLQTNNSLANTLKHLEDRAENAQQRQKKLKQFKRCVKNSSCLQCQHCNKFFVPSIFGHHLNVCLLSPSSSQNEQLTQLLNEKNKTEISIRQTLVRDSDSKPYTQYIIDVKKEGKKWTITRKYKAICDLHAGLKIMFPGIELSQVSYIVTPHQGNKKSMVMQQRRKILEKYLIDLSKIPLVTKSQIWMQFLELNDMEQQHNYDSLSQNKENMKNSTNTQSPEEFMRIWNQRNFRNKQMSIQKKNLIN